MNDLQTLFAVIFGIYFATTVATSGRFYPFDTSAVFTGDWRAFMRLLLAFAFLNLAPVVYFVTVLRILEPLCAGSAASIPRAIGVLSAGLGGFGFYRVFVAIVSLPRGRWSSRFFFYAHPEDYSLIARKERAKLRQPPPDAAVYPFLATFAGGVVWLTATFGVLKWLV